MEGIVKSFVAEKRFGFIDGADSKSYFFHLNDFSPKPEGEALLDGALVTFDPTPTPKGLAAKRLALACHQAVEWVEPGQFLMLRDPAPKKGRIVAAVSAITASSSNSPDAARAYLRGIAFEMGANAVISLTYSKGTGANGNYRYTIHEFSGRPAVVMEPRMTSDLAAVKESERKCLAMSAALIDGHLAYLRRQRLLRIIKYTVITAAVLFALIVVRRNGP